MVTTYQEVSDLIITNLADDSQITASKHRDVENALLIFAKEIAEAQWLPGDVKEVDCTLAYINLQFDANGVGIIGKEREGWAICNGYNGLTKNRAGRVPVGWDKTKTVFESGKTNGMGQTGGSERHVLAVDQMPRHGHKFGPLFRDSNLADNNMPPRGSNLTISGYAQTGVTGGAGSTQFENTTTGTAVAHENMQPYIVTLFIQKL